MLLLAGWFLANSVVAREPVPFNRDVRPILSENCFECHGPDAAKRKADLRLDTGAPGQAIITAGKPSGSELFKRITHADPEERMPPVDSGRALTSSDIETLRAWISQGAKWEKHWAFIPPKRPTIPPAKNSAWPSGAIDRFVLAKLQRAGLQPSPRADRETLLRRVSFDLTGLPPTPREIDAFLADASPRAYESVVDQLLASPRYGERMALDWLDAARYADSHGYSLDRRRVMWPWRDWVIRALNDNMPFDRFALEQLAGDLLPDATIAQRVATGFNRNHSIQSEGGVINEEYRVETVVDRVETTTAVFLGLTFGCARCHDHKYDPISQREFYEFYALFNNVPETAHVGNADKLADKPFVKVPSAAQRKQMEWHRAEIAELEKKPEAEQQLKAARKALAALGQAAPTSMVMGELSPARKTFVLSRGQYDQPSDVEVSAGLPAALGQWPAGAPRNRLGLAKWIARRGEPADGAGGREPFLADALRHRHREIVGGLWRAGRVADAPGAARLAGGRVRAQRVEPEGDAQAHRDVGDVSAGVARVAGAARGRSGEPVVRARAEVSAAGGNDSRPRAGVERVARRPARRRERPAVPAARAVGRCGLRERAAFCAGSRRETLPPQPVHVLEALRATAEHAGIRRAVARGVRADAGQDEHAARRAGADERPDVCRGVAQAGRAGVARRRRDGGVAVDAAASLGLRPATDGARAGFVEQRAGGVANELSRRAGGGTAADGGWRVAARPGARRGGVGRLRVAGQRRARHRRSHYPELKYDSRTRQRDDADPAAVSRPHERGHRLGGVGVAAQPETVRRLGRFSEFRAEG